VNKETILKMSTEVRKKCKWPGCITRLRKGDPEDYCHVHYKYVDKKQKRPTRKNRAEGIKKKKKDWWSL